MPGEWVIKELTESGDSFWNLVFEVPKEFSKDGTYCVSFPKEMVMNYAAIYGYDVDDQGDLDALFKHIAYLGVMTEMDRMEKKDTSSSAPMKMGSASAKKAVHDRIGEIEKKYKVVQKPQVSMRMGLNRFGDSVAGAVTEVDVFEVVRADLALTGKKVEERRRMMDRRTVPNG